MKRAAALVLIVMLCCGQAPAWGEKGHRMLPELALKLLPPDVPVLAQWATTIADLGPEPDRWRAGRPAIKEAQEPDHYLNFEPIEFLSEFPPTRPKYIEAVYEHSLKTGDSLRAETVGFQPYIVAEIFERLRVSFAEYERLRMLKQPTRAVEARIAFYAGWISHYVTDGAQPLHATVNYDGWVAANPEGFTTRRGVHEKFEADFVDDNISASDVIAVRPNIPVIRDLMKDYVAYLRNALLFVRPLYEMEKAGGFDGAGTPESRRFVAERMAAGRDMLAALWTAAWRGSHWEGCLPYTEAPSHAGEVGCLTGTVVSIGRPQSRSGAAPVYLNFCEDFRNCALSIMIPGRALDRFPDLDGWKGKKLQAIGQVTSYKERPLMIVTDPTQLR